MLLRASPRPASTSLDVDMTLGLTREALLNSAVTGTVWCDEKPFLASTSGKASQGVFLQRVSQGSFAARRGSGSVLGSFSTHRPLIVIRRTLFSDLGISGLRLHTPPRKGVVAPQPASRLRHLVTTCMADSRAHQQCRTVERPAAFSYSLSSYRRCRPRRSRYAAAWCKGSQHSLQVVKQLVPQSPIIPFPCWLLRPCLATHR